MQNNNKMPWNILAVALFLTFSIWAPLFSIPPMETILAKNLSISHLQTSLLFSGPIIMLAITAIPAGIIADRIGIKKAIGIGALLTFVGSALRGTATSYSSLLIFSLFFGFGLGWSFANLPKLARSYSPQQQTLVIMGILIGGGVLVGVGLSLAITVPLIYPITNNYKGVFYVWSIPVLIATILWWTTVHEPPWQGDETESGKIQSAGLKQLLKNKILWLLAFLLFLHNFLFYTWSGWMPTYLLEKGANISSAGVMTSVMLWIGVPTAILVPLLSSGANLPRRLLVWIPSLVYAFLTSGILFAPLFSIWFILGISGITNVTRFNTLLTLPVEIMPRERAGAASGVVVAVGYMGAVAGPVVAGHILDVTGSFMIIFGILTVISLIIAGLAFLIPITNR